MTTPSNGLTLRSAREQVNSLALNQLVAFWNVLQFQRQQGLARQCEENLVTDRLQTFGVHPSLNHLLNPV